MQTVQFVQQFATPLLGSAMLAITALGNPEAYIALLAVAYLAINPDLARRAGVYLLLSSYANVHIKAIADTPRPFMLDPDLAHSEAAVETADGRSFPSGHAQNSMVFWGYLAVRIRRPWFWALAAALVALISLSRIYLGVHFPVDIAGGLGIAAAVVAAALLADRYVVPALRAWPVWLLFGLGLLVPLTLHLAMPDQGTDLRTGALAAFLTAPMLIQHRVPDSWWRRIAVAALGLVSVFAVLAGTSALLPEAVKANAFGGFARYLLLGYAGLALLPWFAQAVGLAPRPQAPERDAAGR